MVSDVYNKAEHGDNYGAGQTLGEYSGQNALIILGSMLLGESIGFFADAAGSIAETLDAGARAPGRTPDGTPDITGGGPADTTAPGPTNPDPGGGNPPTPAGNGDVTTGGADSAPAPTDLGGADTGGSATITFDGGHASIEVSGPDGETLTTHPTGGLVELPDGTKIPTPIQVEPSSGTPSPAARSVTFQLPNPGGAMAYQDVMLGRGVTGLYDESTATCFHHCTAVLNAGGVPGVPVGGTTRQIIAFLRRASRAH